MKKRLAAFLLPLAICFSPLAATVSPAPAAYAAAVAGFQDTAGHWSADTVNWGIQNGIVNGYADKTFRPDLPVSEPEFLAMLLRAYPESAPAAAPTGTLWYKPYYEFADARNWPLVHSADAALFNRGQVARIVAATQKSGLNLNDSVRYLLDNGLSGGKSAATVAGYQSADKLTRAEAVQFIRNLKQKQLPLAPSAPAAAAAASSVPQPQEVNTLSVEAVGVKGVQLGDPETEVIAKLGQPARKDLSEYGFYWYIYNGDYSSYAQIGIAGGKVVGLYSTSPNWQYNGIADGTAKDDVINQYGQPLSSILKGNTRFLTNYGKGEYGTYEIDGAFVTFFYDLHRNNVVNSIQIIDKPTELSLASFYPQPSGELSAAYERQSFDLANAGRVKLGKPAFIWDDTIAETARKHSQDMAANSYFAHESLNGASPFDRMKQDGLTLKAAAENIAAGQTSAIFAHESWMNSEGHRKNLLSDIERLGVGVAFGGKMSIYYSQDFYTP